MSKQIGDYDASTDYFDTDHLLIQRGEKGEAYKRLSGASIKTAVAAYVTSNRVVNFLDYAPPLDGFSSCSTKLNAALSETAAASRTLLIPNLGFNWVLGTLISAPENASIILEGEPQFTTSLATAWDVAGPNVRVVGTLRIRAAHSSSSYMVTVDATAERFRFDEIVLTNANSGVLVEAPYGLIKSLIVEEARGTGIKFSGTDAHSNRLMWAEFRNVAGFGAYEELGAGKNQYGPLHKFAIPTKFTTWQRQNRAETGGYPWVSGGTPDASAKYCNYNGQTYTVSGPNATVFGTIPPTHTSGDASDGVNTWTYTGVKVNQIGIECFGATTDCSRSSLMMVHAFGTGDAGVTLTGDYYRVLGGLIEGCYTGWGANGHGNTVVGMTSLNNTTNGGSFSPAAGGEAIFNRAIGCYAEGNGRYGLRNDNVALRLWVSGASYPTASGYCYYGLNVYRIVGAKTDTFGTNPPTHTSGTASDGLVTWEYLRSGASTLDGTKNQFIGCDAFDNGVADWELEGNGQVIRGPYFAADADGTERAHFNLRGPLTAESLGSETWSNLTSAPGGAIDVTNMQLVGLTFTTATSITDITTSTTSLYQRIILQNRNSNVATLVHDTSKIRLLKSIDRKLAAYEMIELVRISGNIWGEAGSVPGPYSAGTTITAVSSNAITVTDYDIVTLNVSGGATINTITAASGPSIVYFRNTGSSGITFTHGSSTIRLNGGVDKTLALYQGMTLLRVPSSTNVWQEV